jgi:hypothetical protein
MSETPTHDRQSYFLLQIKQKYLRKNYFFYIYLYLLFPLILSGSYSILSKYRPTYSCKITLTVLNQSIARIIGNEAVKSLHFKH